jgi:hypothetical protein
MSPPGLRQAPWLQDRRFSPFYALVPRAHLKGLDRKALVVERDKAEPEAQQRGTRKAAHLRMCSLTAVSRTCPCVSLSRARRCRARLSDVRHEAQRGGQVG